MGEGKAPAAEWSAQTIADLYRRRWAIEVFFKQIEQTLRLADFLGNSPTGYDGSRACNPPASVFTLAGGISLSFARVAARISGITCRCSTKSTR